MADGLSGEDALHFGVRGVVGVDHVAVNENPFSLGSTRPEGLHLPVSPSSVHGQYPAFRSISFPVLKVDLRIEE